MLSKIGIQFLCEILSFVIVSCVKVSKLVALYVF